MARRAAPVALVLLAALADRSGDHRLAFYALLVAVPAAAVTALGAVAERVEGGCARTQPLLWGLVLALVVVGAAARAPAVAAGAAPTAARSALLACLGVFSVQAVVALRAELQRERPRRVLREVDDRLDGDERRHRHRERRQHGGLEQQLARR